MARGTVDVESLKEEPELLLNFLREMRKAAFYNSNLFFRDIQYSIRDYFEAEEGKTVTIPQAEKLAREVLRGWQEKGVVRQVNTHAYLLLHKDYLTPKEGTIGLLNVPLSKLPESAIPLPKGMSAVSTAVASHVPQEAIAAMNADASARAEEAKTSAEEKSKDASDAQAPEAQTPGADEPKKPAPPPWLKK